MAGPSPCILILFGYASVARASSNVVGYVDDPDGRGTVSLIVSCVLTLILCVWSALHLNVPGPTCTTRRWIWLNIAWIFAGIYSPEMVVFAAWRQWDSARLLQKRVSELEGRQTASKWTSWSIQHSFFACSGGFALELETLSAALNPSSRGWENQRTRRLTLTPKGILLLAELGCLPQVEREEIQDKSKANDLAKALVIIQATWMLVQAIGRLAAKLPVTLLEVNTVAHVLCAFAMYLFWWHKPLLPNEPIVIRDENLTPLAAFMYSSSEMSGFLSEDQVQSETVVKTLFAKLHLYSKTPELDTVCLQELNVCVKNMGDAGVFIKHGDSSFHFRRAPESCLGELDATREKDSGTAFFERRPRIIHKRSAQDRPTEAEMRRWVLSQSFLQAHPDLLNENISLLHATSSGESCIHLHSEQYVTSHATNWPSSNLLRSTNGLVVGTILWLANLLYGGLHAAAWNDHFPSTAEKWLWRSSSIYIAFCGGLWVLLNLAVARWSRLNKWWEKWMDGEKGVVQSLGLGVTVFVCGFSLVLARMFLVVEAFISIRRLPKEAYDTPQWTDLFPHF